MTHRFKKIPAIKLMRAIYEMVLALALNWAQLADKALCKMIGERSNTPHLLLALLPSIRMPKLGHAIKKIFSLSLELEII